MSKGQEYITLRMDDVGASSKKYEVYSNRSWHAGGIRVSGNWLFLKYLRAFKAWGPYRELSAKEWEEILQILSRFGAKLTVAITAAWAESYGNLIPFPQQFPDQAAVIKKGVELGKLEVANHGLTHSVVENNAFRPKLFKGNRDFHREFGPQVKESVQEDHLRRSQGILRDWLGREVISFVPPGNLFTEDTLRLAKTHGLQFVSCETSRRLDGQSVVLGNESVKAFHDRDLVLGGLSWLENLIRENEGSQFRFISELGKQVLRANGR